MGTLLLEGIGDTIRVSLSDDPVKEVTIGNEILKSLNLRNRGVRIISCPSCARQGFEVINTVKLLEQKLSHIKTPITLSIIGCVVNGPGEAALTDIGITGGGKDSSMLYIKGLQTEKISNNLFNSGVNVITSGNHIWDKKETSDYINKEKRLLRPANLLEDSPGNGYGIYLTKNQKYKVGVRRFNINWVGAYTLYI